MKYLLNIPTMSTLELKYVNSVIKQNWLTIKGDHTQSFEKKFAKLVNRKFSIALQSGTAALHTALKALGVKKNDKVFIPNYSCVSTISCLSQLGASPIILDIENETLGLDFNLLKSAYKKHKAKFLQLVHVYGCPARDTNKIIQFCKKNKIKVLEDASESLGAQISKKPIGSFGDISIFSARSEKMIGCGEGGILLSNDKKLFKNAELIASRHAPFRGKSDPYWKKYFVNGEGYNYLMPHLPGAVAHAQISRFKKDILPKKIKVGKLYKKIFLENSNYSLIQSNVKNVKKSFWLNGIFFKKINSTKVRKIGEKLRKEGVEIRSGFWPLNKMKCFKSTYVYKDNISELIFKNSIILPSNIHLREKDIKFFKKIIDRNFK